MAKQSALLPTTSLLDASQIYTIDVNKPEFKELLVSLWQTVNEMSLVINMKDTGYYTETEFINSQVYFPDPALAVSTNTNPIYRPVHRLVVNFGALPNTGSTAVAHGLTFTNSYIFTRIYGAASDQTAVRNYIPLPYASPTLVNNIELKVDDTNITVTTGSNRTNFTECYVVLEYIKY